MMLAWMPPRNGTNSVVCRSEQRKIHQPLEQVQTIEIFFKLE